MTGSNNNGVWNEEGQSLHITIHRPPWYSWWAITLYVLILTGLILWFRILLLKRARTIRALEIERIDKEKVVELDRMKSRFFTNISHEFRTPLSLIKGPVENALRSVKKSIHLEREEAEMMERNAARLQELIDQLLDISKLESGTERLRVAEGNLEKCIRSVFSNFLSLAESRHIRYRLDLSGGLQVVWFDADKVEKILVNLINNAFKFTGNGGTILVTLTGVHEQDGKDAVHAELTVKDTGAGIPPERIDRIFDRFYQVDGSDTREQEGTGIGLSLVKELVDLYRGEIEVESVIDSGTTFRVKLPVARELFREEEQVERSVSGEKPSAPRVRAARDESSRSAKEKGGMPERHDSAPLLLVIEDNDDLRRYISSMLDGSYRVLMAENGTQGLDLVMEHLPDLVISDVMMPGMDGYAVCRQIKETEQTSHIPVILLTAKADQGSKIEGLETGADDYIGKPFDLPELQARIRNLIDQRKRLREQFKRQFAANPGSEVPLSSNDILLQKIISIIKQHLADADFTMAGMASELNISRSHLFRKVSAVTGYTPNDLLRIMRMRRAAVLFDSGENNVSRVMYEVGYNNPSYFSRCFRELHGMNPSRYIRRKR